MAGGVAKNVAAGGAGAAADPVWRGVAGPPGETAERSARRDLRALQRSAGRRAAVDRDAECDGGRGGALWGGGGRDDERRGAAGTIQLRRVALAGSAGAVAGGSRAAARAAGERAVCAQGGGGAHVGR